MMEAEGGGTRTYRRLREIGVECFVHLFRMANSTQQVAFRVPEHGPMKLSFRGIRIQELNQIQPIQ
jgi:hypothetical protein